MGLRDRRIIYFNLQNTLLKYGTVIVRYFVHTKYHDGKMYHNVTFNQFCTRNFRENAYRLNGPVRYS